MFSTWRTGRQMIWFVLQTAHTPIASLWQVTWPFCTAPHLTCETRTLPRSQGSCLPALIDLPLTPLGLLGGRKRGNTECINVGMSDCTPKQSHSLLAWERLNNERAAQGAVNPNKPFPSFTKMHTKCLQILWLHLFLDYCS